MHVKKNGIFVEINNDYGYIGDSFECTQCKTIIISNFGYSCKLDHMDKIADKVEKVKLKKIVKKKLKLIED